MARRNRCGGRWASDRLGNGYVKTHDGKTLFLLITPHSSDDSLPTRRALLAAPAREHVEAAARG